LPFGFTARTVGKSSAINQRASAVHVEWPARAREKSVRGVRFAYTSED
jgi:hypothetical protein